MTKYILADDGQTPIRCDDLIAWAKWFERAERRVALHQVGRLEVSTVFLGMDHRFTDDGPPILWETMIFGFDDLDEEYQTRAVSYQQALKQHEAAVQYAKRLNSWWGRICDWLRPANRR